MTDMYKHVFRVIDLHFEARLQDGESGQYAWYQIGQSGARFGELVAEANNFMSRLFQAKSSVHDTDGANPEPASVSAAALRGMAHDFGSALPDATGFCDEDQIEALVADVLDKFRNRYAGDDVNAIGQVSEDMFGVDYRKFAGVKYRLVWFGYDEKCVDVDAYTASLRAQLRDWDAGRAVKPRKAE